MSADPAQHEAHEFPLAARIIDGLIGEWLQQHTAIATAAAGSGCLSDYERGVHAGIDRLHHGHLTGFTYNLTPLILDALRRAGLLADRETEPTP